MQINIMKKIMLSCAMLLLILSATVAQNVQYQVNQASSKVHVDGDSNIRQYAVQVESFDGKVIARDSAEQPVESVNISFQVESMKGGRGEIMDNKILKAFDYTNNPTVSFQSEEVLMKEVDGKTILQCSGSLSMAGMTKSTTIETEADLSNFVFIGSKTLTFTEYGMEPPSALFGSLKCDDEITVVWELSFEKISN
jgi:polyisoprenoid-binding protein YceI